MFVSGFGCILHWSSLILFDHPSRRTVFTEASSSAEASRPRWHCLHCGWGLPHSDHDGAPLKNVYIKVSSKWRRSISPQASETSDFWLSAAFVTCLAAGNQLVGTPNSGGFEVVSCFFLFQGIFCIFWILLYISKWIVLPEVSNSHRGGGPPSPPPPPYTN